MKTSLAIVCLLAPSLAATAQIAAFQQLDQNGDGKLSRDEAPNSASFAQADAGKDGAVTPDEFRRYLERRRNQRDAPEKPDPASPPAGEPLGSLSAHAANPNQ
jgi:hypothetical protein